MTFKNISANSFDGLVVARRGERLTPEKIYHEYDVIPGTSKELFVDTGNYKPYKREVALLAHDPSQVESIMLWLDGAGRLSFKDDVGFFLARVIEVKKETMPFKEVLFEVEFMIQPFFWLDSGLTTITHTASGVVTNPGNLPSKPVIKVIGSGDITLNIGAKSYILTGIDGEVIIDSERLMVYKNTLNQGSKLTGGFPEFKTGENNVSWTGMVTRLEIIGNWRNL